jgi:transcriptional regulator with XRE-family HTH domain
MGNSLRKLRQAKGITLLELAKRLNTNEATLSRMETSKQTIPDSFAVILADFFAVSLDFLLKRSFEQPEKLVYKERDITYELVLSKLHTFSNQELVRIIGAAEGTLQAREGQSSNGQYNVKPTVDIAKKPQS